MRVFVAHASNFDFREKLYKPLRESELNTQHEFFLPQETDEDYVDLEFIRSCDALIVDVSIPSSGAGIEMGWANASGVPILGVYEKGSHPSASAAYPTKQYVEYSDSKDLIEKVGAFLKTLSK